MGDAGERLTSWSRKRSAAWAGRLPGNGDEHGHPYHGSVARVVFQCARFPGATEVFPTHSEILPRLSVDSRVLFFRGELVSLTGSSGRDNHIDALSRSMFGALSAICELNCLQRTCQSAHNERHLSLWAGQRKNGGLIFRYARRLGTRGFAPARRVRRPWGHATYTVSAESRMAARRNVLWTPSHVSARAK
jgi:hypothetical protein